MENGQDAGACCPLRMYWFYLNGIQTTLGDMFLSIKRAPMDHRAANAPIFVSALCDRENIVVPANWHNVSRCGSSVLP